MKLYNFQSGADPPDYFHNEYDLNGNIHTVPDI